MRNKWGSSVCYLTSVVQHGFGDCCSVLLLSTLNLNLQQHCHCVRATYTHSVPPSLHSGCCTSFGEALRLHLVPPIRHFVRTVPYGDAIPPLCNVMRQSARSRTLAEATNNHCRSRKTMLRARFDVIGQSDMPL